MNATLRARRSSLAIISVALPLRAASKAFANSGLRALAAFNLDVLADYGGAVLTGKRLDGGALLPGGKNIVGGLTGLGGEQVANLFRDRAVGGIERGHRIGRGLGCHCGSGRSLTSTCRRSSTTAGPTGCSANSG